MPQYVVTAKHSSDQCPTANSKTRQLMVRGAKELPQLAQRLKIQFIVGPLILGAEHESVAVVEADRYETVQDFILQSGLVQWNAVRISPAMTQEEALAKLEKVPPPLY